MTHFIKSKEIAFALDKDAIIAKKDVYLCCPQCDGKPLYSQKGYLVKTEKTKSELSKLGILVSSTLYAYNQ